MQILGIFGMVHFKIVLFALLYHCYFCEVSVSVYMHTSFKCGPADTATVLQTASNRKKSHTLSSSGDTWGVSGDPWGVSGDTWGVSCESDVQKTDM